MCHTSLSTRLEARRNKRRTEQATRDFFPDIDIHFDKRRHKASHRPKNNSWGSMLLMWNQKYTRTNMGAIGRKQEQPRILLKNHQFSLSLSLSFSLQRKRREYSHRLKHISRDGNVVCLHFCLRFSAMQPFFHCRMLLLLSSRFVPSFPSGVG